MAKRKAMPGIEFTSEVIRHVNRSTMDANSATGVAEAISTPGYSENGMTGCMIMGAQVSFDVNSTKGLAATTITYVCQIQTGDRSATPTLIDPDEVGFFGQVILKSIFTTSGTDHVIYPLPINISMPVPIVVLPAITIVHQTSADSTSFDTDDIFVELFYRTVKLRPEAYTGLLLSQQRTS